MEKQAQVDRVNQARNVLIDELKKNGVIVSAALERAFRVVPRHVLLKGVVDPVEAYANKTIVLKRDEEGRIFEKGRTLSSSTLPILVAAMLESLDLSPRMKILEIGTASGYQTALLAELVGDFSKVYTMEIDKEIAGRAKERLREAGYEGLHVICGDGGYGYSEAAPYDRIIVTAGCSDLSPYWLEQLKEKGSLLVPFCFSRRGGSYPVVKLRKAKGEYRGEFPSKLHNIGFVPLYGDFETLTYDAAIFKVLQTVHQRWFTEIRPENEAAGLVLLTHLYLAHCTERKLSFLKMDGQNIDRLASRIERRWISLRRPTPSDFSLRLLDKETDLQRKGWLFRRENWNIAVYVTK